MRKNVYWIDLFCGAGGVSTGIHKAGQKVLACINHDKNAILSHSANYPDVLHFTEDIRTVALQPLLEIVRQTKQQDKNAIICLWASLECTNYSKAKGGQSRDADSRTLAQHLFRYLEAINFDYVYIENVEEFMSWGPLVAKTERVKGVEVCPLRYDKKLKKMQPTWVPESKTSGRDYTAWIKQMESYGFLHEHKILNCADYGDPTRRLRYFGIFAKKGLPIRFPNATHTNPNKVVKQATLFTASLQPWRAVKECLDFSDVGESIFLRKKPLVEKTLRRIYAGLIKFVMNGKEGEVLVEECYQQIKAMKGELIVPIHLSTNANPTPFINKYLSNSPTTGISTPQSIDNPCSTVTTQGRLTLVQPTAFLAGAYSSPNIQADLSKVTSIESPCPTITTIPHHSIVFLNKYYGSNNSDNQSNNAVTLELPCPTVLSKDKLSVVFIDKYYGKSVAASVDLPANTVTTVDRMSMVSCYLLNPQYNNTGSSIEQPCFTIIARMDKKPPYMVSIMDTDTQAAIIIRGQDSEYMKRIKLAMAIYGLCDVKMRMLSVQELKLIQSFPANYRLIGTQAEQKKYIGNAVPSETVRHLVSMLG